MSDDDDRVKDGDRAEDTVWDADDTDDGPPQQSPGCSHCLPASSSCQRDSSDPSGPFC